MLQGNVFDKISITLFSRYVTESDFEEVVKYFSEEKFVAASECISPSKEDSSIIKIFAALGGDDFENEGHFETYRTNQPIEYLPWAAGRPNAGGFDYGCLTFSMSFKTENETISVLKSEVLDEVCFRSPGYCPLCTVESPTREIRVRGLCKDTIFDNLYHFNIGEDGKMMLLGEEESRVKYDKGIQVWQWTDRNLKNGSGK